MVRHQVVGALIGGVFSLALACAGCNPTSGGSSGAPTAAAASARPAATQASASPQAPKPPSCAGRVFPRRTTAQRAGQLFTVGIAGSPRSVVARAVASYHFGSLMFGTTTTASLAEIRQVTTADQALASESATARVRFFISADQEGGQLPLGHGRRDRREASAPQPLDLAAFLVGGDEEPGPRGGRRVGTRAEAGRRQP